MTYRLLDHDAILTDDGFRKKLYCRLVALILVETAEEFAQLMEWEFRQLVAAVYDDPDKRVLAWIKALASWRNRHDGFFARYKEFRLSHHLAQWAADDHSRRQTESTL